MSKPRPTALIWLLIAVSLLIPASQVAARPPDIGQHREAPFAMARKQSADPVDHRQARQPGQALRSPSTPSDPGGEEVVPGVTVEQLSDHSIAVTIDGLEITEDSFERFEELAGGGGHGGIEDRTLARLKDLDNYYRDVERRSGMTMAQVQDKMREKLAGGGQDRGGVATAATASRSQVYRAIADCTMLAETGHLDDRSGTYAKVEVSKGGQCTYFFDFAATARANAGPDADVDEQHSKSTPVYAAAEIGGRSDCRAIANAHASFLFDIPDISANPIFVDIAVQTNFCVPGESDQPDITDYTMIPATVPFGGSATPRYTIEHRGYDLDEMQCWFPEEVRTDRSVRWPTAPSPCDKPLPVYFYKSGTFLLGITVQTPRGFHSTAFAEVYVEPEPTRPPNVDLRGFSPSRVEPREPSTAAHTVSHPTGKYTSGEMRCQLVAPGVQTNTRDCNDRLTIEFPTPGTRTVTLLVTTPDGQSATDTAQLEVEASPPPPPPSAPRINRLELSDDDIRVDEKTRLSWSVSNPNACEVVVRPAGDSSRETTSTSFAGSCAQGSADIRIPTPGSWEAGYRTWDGPPIPNSRVQKFVPLTVSTGGRLVPASDTPTFVACLDRACTDTIRLDGTKPIRTNTFGLRLTGIRSSKIEFSVDGRRQATERFAPFDAYTTTDGGGSVPRYHADGDHIVMAVAADRTIYIASFTVNTSTAPTTPASNPDLVACLDPACDRTLPLDGATLTSPTGPRTVTATFTVE